MPKAPSSTKGKKASRSAFKPLDPKQARQQSLAQELREDQLRSKFGVVSAPGKRNKSKAKGKERESEDEGSDDESRGRITGAQRFGSNDSRNAGYVDPKLSRNILRLAQQQQDEMEAEEEAERTGIDPRIRDRGDESAGPSSARRGFGASQLDFGEEDDDEDLDEDDDGELNEEEAQSGDEDLETEYAALDIDPEDRRLMEQMDATSRTQSCPKALIGGEHADLEEALPVPEAGGGRTLADIIMAKLEEAETNQGAVPVNAQERPMPPGINPKVIEVYTKVGELLSRYKSGPLPKAFKIIPSLPAWETIVYITNPAGWTPHATLAATHIFVSNLKPAQTQKFFELVLLDKVRDEIAEKNKLSVQTYDALKKGLYKPAAFFKGLLFPLCESGTVTLKEAAIISSVLAKVSVPVLHSAAALLHLASMPYKGPTSLFIRVLLDKKYALPYKVVDALVFHFLRFADPSKGVEMEKINGTSTGERRMPVLWHQSLLVFAQRYKQDLTPDQKTALLDLLRVQKHDAIGAEVRRELISGVARGELLDEPIGDGEFSEDDAMSV